MEIKTVLCPTDFMEGSQEAVKYAVDIAKKYEAKLILLHVIHDLKKVTGWYVPHITMDELYKDIESGAMKELDKIFAEELRGFDNTERKILKGIPYVEIIRFAEDNKIDLIVMGTHGRKGLDRMIFGSTAEHVVKNAGCPVLTARIR
ncbi:putative universal stress protein [bacterium BMS3Abin07]|nr:putative universal stress protein [bacterium BMS3Abin07]GBE32624.1 putative universal stress protein [bacterium BMS3Bbin05]